MEQTNNNLNVDIDDLVNDQDDIDDIDDIDNYDDDDNDYNNEYWCNDDFNNSELLMIEEIKKLIKLRRFSLTKNLLTTIVNNNVDAQIQCNNNDFPYGIEDVLNLVQIEVVDQFDRILEKLLLIELENKNTLVKKILTNANEILAINSYLQELSKKEDVSNLTRNSIIPRVCTKLSLNNRRDSRRIYNSIQRVFTNNSKIGDKYKSF